MDIVIFVLRTVFLVLIYVYVYIVFVHLLRDLRETGAQPAGEPGSLRETGKPGGSKAGSRRGKDNGVLTVDSSPGEYGMNGAEFVLTDGTRLGRGMKNDVVLPDPYASNRHAVIHLRNGQYWLEDLDSRNGTFLNGVRLTRPAVLAHGDQIRIGDIIFSFVRWENAVEHDHRMRAGTVDK